MEGKRERSVCGGRREGWVRDGRQWRRGVS